MVKLARIAIATFALVLCGPGQAGAFGQIDSINGFAGGWSDTTYKLSSPNAITRAPDGYYVADSIAKRIVKLDNDGRFVSSFSIPVSPGGSPVAIEYADSGLYVLDLNYLRRISLSGQVLWTAGGPGDGNPCKFKWAMDMAIDPKSHLIYVADYQNQWISIWGANGTCKSVGLTGASGPTSVAFADGGKEMLVADAAAGLIKVWVDTGSQVSVPNWNLQQSLGANDGTASGTSSLQRIAVDQPGAPGSSFRVYLSLFPYKNCVKGFDALTNGGDATAGFSHQLVYAGTIGTCNTSSIFGGTPQVIADGSSMLAADAENHRIVRLSGVLGAPAVDSTWGGDLSKPDYITQAASIAVAPSGESYVLDSAPGAPGKVRRYGANGRLIGAFGSFGTGTFYTDNPTSIARSPNGDILVSDPKSHSILRFAANGTQLTSVLPSTLLGNVWGLALPDFNPGPLAVDANGVIFAIDRTSGGDKIVRLSPDGVLLQNFGTQVGQGDAPGDGGTYYSLTDIAVKPDGQTVYVSDKLVLKKFTFESGNWTGHDSSAPFLEGAPAADRFSNPLFISWDQQGGDLATSDFVHGRILRISEQDNNWTVTSRYPEPPATNTIAGLAKTGIDSSGKIYAVTGGESVVRLGEAPSVTVSAPATGTETTAASISLNFTSDDAMASCDRTSGDVLPLELGANSITVTCTNPQGSGSATVVVTRTAADSSAKPPKSTSSGLMLTIPFGHRLTKTRKVRFTVTCPVACTVGGSLRISRKKYHVRQLKLPAAEASRKVSLRLSRSAARRARSAIKKHRRVRLLVTLRSADGQAVKTGSIRLKR
jgi:sugar lactone lactonase YvrE